MFRNHNLDYTQLEIQKLIQCNWHKNMKNDKSVPKSNFFLRVLIMKHEE